MIVHYQAKLRSIFNLNVIKSFRRRICQLLLEGHRALLAFPRAVNFYQGSPWLAVQRAYIVWRRDGLAGIQRRMNILLGGQMSDGEDFPDVVDYYGYMPAANPEFNPKVTIIVPNYNQGTYLRQRLESIYRQTYQYFDVVLLDDCSSDGSLEILQEYAECFSDKTVCVFNDVNSGSVFKQWKKGFEFASGELIWIAECDDFCSENFLVEQVRAFQNPAVMLSFCNTEFVSSDQTSKILSLREYLADIDITGWESSFIASAHTLVSTGWAIKNIVPNVSGALFRHPRNFPLLDDPRWFGLRMCGDWVFYLSVVRGGLVAYTTATTNYYRQHNYSTSQPTQKVDQYYVEHEVVASHLAKLYHLERDVFEKQRSVLYHHWCCQRGNTQQAEFKRLYNLDRVLNSGIVRLPNIVMAVYALTTGGGEIFPIMLANLLHERGYAVTLLNCLEKPTEPGVLKMISSRIPRLELSRLELAGAVLSNMGIELVHSHHAWVDLTLASLLLTKKNIKQVISMHGMYEMMTPNQLDSLMPLLSARIDHFVFTADKNLDCFPQSFLQSKNFTRIGNSLPEASINPIARDSLNIGREDFVLCMVARGIPEKGWIEAIKAVNLANAQSQRKIHLILIGDGPEYDRLHNIEQSETVHFLGFRQNIRDYFASSDMGFLPSRFKGESAPLVLIDCLLAGKPMLASDIGEIRRMLDSQDGLAGELFPLKEWKIDVKELSRLLVNLATDDSRYLTLCTKVVSAAHKFSVITMIESYETVYRKVLSQPATIS